MDECKIPKVDGLYNDSQHYKETVMNEYIGKRGSVEKNGGLFHGKFDYLRHPDSNEIIPLCITLKIKGSDNEIPLIGYPIGWRSRGHIVTVEHD